jgi:hypothetical protein
MTRRDLTRLFIKVFGLLILLSIAISLPTTIYAFLLVIKGWVEGRALDSWPPASRVVYDLPSLVMALTYQFGPTAIYAALGLSFMWWSGRIVDRASLAPQDDGLPVASADLESIEVSLVTVIGLYFLADGFAELCRITFSPGFYYALNGSLTPKSIWTDLIVLGPELLQIMVTLTIGAALVLGRGATVAMVHRARHWVQKWRAWPYQPEEDRAR